MAAAAQQSELPQRVITRSQALMERAADRAGQDGLAATEDSTAPLSAEGAATAATAAATSGELADNDALGTPAEENPPAAAEEPSLCAQRWRKFSTGVLRSARAHTAAPAALAPACHDHTLSQPLSTCLLYTSPSPRD